MSFERVIFEPYPKQEEYIEAVFSGKYSLLVYGGAMGGGKSYVNLATLILLAKIYPRSKWCVIRESIPTLKKTTLETFKKIVPSNFLINYNQQDHIAYFKNGSQIMFMAEDYANDKDFDRFKGLEVNGFLLEQIEELHEGLLDVCFIRAGRWSIPATMDDPDPKQPDPLVMANMNPTLTWPKTKIYDPWCKGQLPKDWYYLPAKITDNPKLFDDKKYMSRLDNLDDLTKRRLIDGDWTAFAVDKPFLYAYQASKHEAEHYTPNENLPLIISFDFNKDPMTCVIGQSLHVRHLCVFDEIKIHNGSTPELCETLLAKYPDWIGRFIVTGDASGNNRSPLVRGGLNHYIIIKKALKVKDFQFRVRRANISHINSRVLCNSVLQNAEFSITNNCHEAILDCVTAEVDEEGEIVKTKDQGRHFLDGLRYIIDSTFPDFIDNPKKYKKQ